MKSLPLTANPRSLVKSTGVKKLRREGRVPAVVYGRGSDPENLEIDAKELTNLINSTVAENILVELSVDGKSRLALLQDVQHHPLKGDVLHVDLHQVAENEVIEVVVPIQTVGEAIGVKVGGGLLEHVLHKVRVRSLPKDLPESIQVDVSPLETGHTLHIGDIVAPEGVTVLGDKNIPVCSIAKSRASRSEEGAAAAAAKAEGGEGEEKAQS
jgi:large subunit ribosomal protein L25